MSHENSPLIVLPVKVYGKHLHERNIFCLRFFLVRNK